mgnify:CR=1 FL=1
MAVVVLSIDSSTFSLDGIVYLRNFQSLVHNDNIRITNSYDSNQILLDSTIYSDFTLDGTSYASAALLQAALATVLFNRAAGAGADKFSEHDQAIAASVWNVAHNLDKYPSVTVIDTANTTVAGKVVYTDSNNLVITFNNSFSGKAYIN